MLRGREVRQQRYGGYYAVSLGGGRHTVKLYTPGSRKQPDIYVSTQPTPEATEQELHALREGYEL